MATKKFSELRKGITDDPVRAARLADAESVAAAEYKRYEAGLAELRRARNLTQVQLAKNLGISQPEVSRIEHQSDVYLSTLRSYVAATGGDLDLVARFGAEGVSLTLEDVFDDDEATPGRDLGPVFGTEGTSDVSLSLALGAINPDTRASALRAIAAGLRDREQTHLAAVIYALAAEADVDVSGKQGAAQALGTTGGLARKNHANRLAEALWRRSLNFDPTNIRSRAALGQHLHHVGEYAEAIEHLRMVAGVDNRASLFLGWSLLLVGLQDKDEKVVADGLGRVVGALRTWSYSAPRNERGPWLRQTRRLASLGDKFLPEVEQLIAFANANSHWPEVTMDVVAAASDQADNQDDFIDDPSDVSDRAEAQL
jgi:DNA-binding XRE family transcriptional regulator